MKMNDEAKKMAEIKSAPSLPRYEHIGPTPAFRVRAETMKAADGDVTNSVEVEVFDPATSAAATVTAERVVIGDRS